MKLFSHQIDGLNWKPIKGYEGQYEVSDAGDVCSVITTQSRRKRILKPHVKNGYLAVNLCKDGACKHFYVHRLVAIAFISNPDNLSEVNHIDCDKTNNHIDNLEWCDRHYNLQHSYAHGLKRIGESHGCAKLTEDEVRAIRALRGKLPIKEIAQRFGIAQCTVSAIQLHRIWKGVV